MPRPRRFARCRGNGLLDLLDDGMLGLVLPMLDSAAVLALLGTSKGLFQRVVCLSSKLLLRVPVARPVGARCVLDMAPVNRLCVHAAAHEQQVPGAAAAGAAGTGHGPMLHGLMGGVLQCSRAHEDASVHKPVHLQRFNALQYLTLEGLDLPCLLPSIIAATCPNLHTVHLDACQLQALAAPAAPAHLCTPSNVRTLGLRHVRVAPPQVSAGSSGGVSEEHQPSEQLRQLLPRLTSLQLQSCQLGHHLLLALGPQLTHLLLDCRSAPMSPGVLGICTQLQHFCLEDLGFLPSAAEWSACGLSSVRHLVMPHVAVKAPQEVELLLQMVHVTHLEVACFLGITTDFSSRQCSWQQLRLHLVCALNGCGVLQLSSLAHLPLHSLKAPLSVAASSTLLQPGVPCALKVQLPHEPAALAGLTQLASRLCTCGLDPRGRKDLIWDGDLTDELAGTALAAIAPVFGSHWQSVEVAGGLQLGQQVVDALVAQYSTSLSCLRISTMHFSGLRRRDQMWRALLHDWPALQRVEVDAGPLSMCMSLHHYGHEEVQAEMAAMMADLIVGLAVNLCHATNGRLLQLQVSLDTGLLPDTGAIWDGMKQELGNVLQQLDFRVFEGELHEGQRQDQQSVVVQMRRTPVVYQCGSAECCGHQSDGYSDCDEEDWDEED